MDLGDLLILMFIVFSVLSSLAAGKKRKRKVPPAAPRPRPRQQRAASRGSTAPREVQPRPDYSPDPVVGGGASSQMQEILRQLGLDVTVEPEESAEIELSEEPSPPPIVREEPQVVSLEGRSLESASPDVERRHEEFHKKYVKPFQGTTTGRSISKGRLRLNPESLRNAIILHEILGPPKGMR